MGDLCQTHSIRPALLPWYQNQNQKTERKPQTDIPGEHISKIFQQNTNQPNPAVYWKYHKPWPTGI